MPYSRKHPGNPMKIEKIAIAVTFFYVAERLKYLHGIASEFAGLGDRYKVFVVTNSTDPEERARIAAVFAPDADLEIVSPTLMGHPYLLTWCHFDVFRRLFNEEPGYTHFMYLEDDIKVTRENITYWLQGREALRRHGLLPSFMRYEVKQGDSTRYSTDVTQPIRFASAPKIVVAPGYCYINLRHPYQGMYLLDRELMQEHLTGGSASPDFGPWLIRETATQGLTFSKVPKGFRSRNLVGYDLSQGHIDPAALIHHTPNNYADNPDSPYGKIATGDVIRKRRWGIF